MQRDGRTSRSFARALAFIVLSAIGLSAQSSPESSARRTDDTFDVVSIRPHEGRVRNASAMRPGGRFQSESTLRQLIRYAYGLEPYQRLAGTSDVLDRQFVIEARVAPERVSATGSHLPMVRALLAERFKLRVRFEDEIQTVATIVRRESDKPGLRLRALTHDCRLPSPPEDKRPPCTLAIIDGHLKAVVPNMADFARRLSYSGRAFVRGTDDDAASQERPATRGLAPDCPGPYRITRSRELQGNVSPNCGCADTGGNGNVPRGSIGSLTFVEVLRDRFDPLASVDTAAHELGHQFGLLGDGVGNQGIMNGQSFEFIPAHINILR
ncbi:MAG: TIGR03435 family protein [Vicinamibacterales bacterium]